MVEPMCDICAPRSLAGFNITLRGLHGRLLLSASLIPGHPLESTQGPGTRLVHTSHIQQIVIYWVCTRLISHMKSFHPAYR